MISFELKEKIIQEKRNNKELRKLGIKFVAQNIIVVAIVVIRIISF